MRAGGTSQTTLNYTGQRLDDTGLLFYNARYYDPALGRFISADTVVPGNASGGMDGVALRPLTVGFFETGFISKLNLENQFGPWYTLSDDARQQVGSPWGPSNPQALNRYSYVLNNPMRWTDPTGHQTLTKDQAALVALYIRNTVIPQIEAGGAKDIIDGGILGWLSTLGTVGSVIAGMLGAKDGNLSALRAAEMLANELDYFAEYAPDGTTISFFFTDVSQHGCYSEGCAHFYSMQLAWSNGKHKRGWGVSYEIYDEFTSRGFESRQGRYWPGEQGGGVGWLVINQNTHIGYDN